MPVQKNTKVSVESDEFVEYSFVEQAKIFRVFSLIRLLKQPSGHSVRKLADEHLDCTERTVFRYLNLLKAVGYRVDSFTRTDSQGKAEKHYYITEAADGAERYFTEQEARLLRVRLASLGEPSPLLDSIWRKVKLTSELVPLPDELRVLNQAAFIDRLQQAIKDRQRVVLRQYRSTNSATVRDRVVEPMALSDKFNQLVAIEVEKGERRTYNISRMQDVDILEKEPCVFPAGTWEPDLFGMADTDWQPVVLQLTERAYQLLILEYPDALLYCLPVKAGPGRGEATGAGPEWAHEFRYQVRGYEGIGRFVMGLPTETRVVAPEAFRTFVREKSARATW